MTCDYFENINEDTIKYLINSKKNKNILKNSDTLQQKFKNIFNNSNILEMICFHKFNINNPVSENKYKFCKILNVVENKIILSEDKKNLIAVYKNYLSPYSIDNFKILRERVKKYDKIRTEINNIWNELINFKNNNDLKKRIMDAGAYIYLGDHTKINFDELWFHLGCYLEEFICDSEEADDLFIKEHGENIYSDFIQKLKSDIKNKKLGLSILLDFKNKININDINKYVEHRFNNICEINNYLKK